jgi:hypothetical protein
MIQLLRDRVLRFWVVDSQSAPSDDKDKPRDYTVVHDSFGGMIVGRKRDLKWACSCKSFTYHPGDCKHIKDCKEDLRRDNERTSHLG